MYAQKHLGKVYIMYKVQGMNKVKAVYLMAQSVYVGEHDRLEHDRSELGHMGGVCEGYGLRKEAVEVLGSHSLKGSEKNKKSCFFFLFVCFMNSLIS